MWRARVAYHIVLFHFDDSIFVLLFVGELDEDLFQRRLAQTVFFHGQLVAGCEMIRSLAIGFKNVGMRAFTVFEKFESVGQRDDAVLSDAEDDAVLEGLLDEGLAEEALDEIGQLLAALVPRRRHVAGAGLAARLGRQTLQFDLEDVAAAVAVLQVLRRSKTPQLACFFRSENYLLLVLTMKEEISIRLDVVDEPLTMMPMREQRASASSMEWVVRMAPRRPRNDAEMVFQRKRFDCGSMPVLGSSMRTMAGRPSIDRA